MIPAIQNNIDVFVANDGFNENNKMQKRLPDGVSGNYEYMHVKLY